MKVFVSKDLSRGIMVNDDFDGIEKSFGFTNVLVCDPESIIEDEELAETENTNFIWTDGITVKDVVEMFRLKNYELANFFDIPPRTISNWTCSGSQHRDCPDYIPKMMVRILKEDRRMLEKRLERMNK